MNAKIKISLKSMEKILKQQGAKRISKSAKERLSLFLKNEAQKISDLAISNARHFGRKLIISKDIEYAIKKIHKNI